MDRLSQESNRLICRSGAETVWVEPWGQDTLRVRCTVNEEMIEQYVVQGETYQLRIKTDTGTMHSVVLKGFAIPMRAIFDESKKLAAAQDILRNDI